MARVSVRNGLRLGVLVSLGFALAVQTAQATPRPRARRVLNLFSGFLGRQNVNRFDCGLDAVGQVCVDPNGSTTVGGGFWPKGTPDQYVFNSGLQLAGIVDPGITGFGWAGDTVGAFFFDPKGTTQHGDRLSLVWSSLDPTDNANWPRDAYVPNDTSLFNPVLIGLKAASQQDTWSRYWDGNPAFNAGRKHPLGVLVEQRGMAWNFPTGNEDIIYYLYTFTNISASTGSAYAGRPDADSLTKLGARFQALNEAAFGVTIPDTGYTIKEMYAAFAMDADVSDAARENYSTAFLPFNMGTAFKRNWYAPSMLFPASVFGAPFAAAPGIVGVKYLKSPVVAGQEVGLTMFSNTINGGQFDDAQNTTQLWRYLSAKLDPTAGDAPCNNPGTPATTHVCFVTQSSDDIRFFQSSGPMDLKPGESKTIVVAYIAAAPVNTPAIANRGQALDLKPGFPVQPDKLAPLGTDTLRSVDRVFGAISVVGDTGGALAGGPNGRIDQNEVRTVPRSLLNKGLVAQAVFNAHFLLPFPPAAPEFFLVPGDNEVSVVWKPSTTETDTIGDPYFKVASDPSSVLFDPNYKQRDVEGYRIYRGRTSGDLQLIAQFDYAGTRFIDKTAAFDYGNCAPELGVTTDCPPGYNTTGVSHDLTGDVVQVPAGGRVATLPDTGIVVLQADTAVTGGGAEGQCRPTRCPPLTNTGVPFSFTDRSVKNSFTYYYAVTAFDVNSITSVGAGNTSLESPRTTRTVTPRKAGANTGTPAGPVTATVVDRADQPLGGSAPTIDPATGEFSGPAAPTQAMEAADLTLFAPTLLQPNAVAYIRIDSVVPAFYHTATYYASGVSGVAIENFLGPDGPLGEEDGDVLLGPAKAAIPADTTLAKQQGLGPVNLAAEAHANIILHAVTFTSKDADWHPAVDGANFEATNPPITNAGGSRWFAGANESTPNPTVALAHGTLPGVTAIMRPGRTQGAPVLFRRFDQTTYHLFRAADIKIYWGATPGKPDSVIDVTHNMPVPFSPQNRASWGFLRDVAGKDTTGPDAAGPDGVLNSLDFMFGACLPGVTDFQQGAKGLTTTTCETRKYDSTAVLLPTDITTTWPGSLAPDGQGFGMYINGEPFLFAATTLPSNTVWTYRSYMGAVTLTAGTYTFTQKPSNPPVPGLRLKITTTTPAVVNRAESGDLSQVHTVPDPYYVTNSFEQSSNSKKLRFVNLPSQAIVRIYSLSGVLVQVLTVNDATGGGELEWNLRNRNNQFVASGVYFYHVEAPDGKTKVGRFTVVNFAQ
jgi:hypothetical protein